MEGRGITNVAMPGQGDEGEEQEDRKCYRVGEINMETDECGEDIFDREEAGETKEENRKCITEQRVCHESEAFFVPEFFYVGWHRGKRGNLWLSGCSVCAVVPFQNLLFDDGECILPGGLSDDGTEIGLQGIDMDTSVRSVDGDFVTRTRQTEEWLQWQGTTGG